MKWRKAGEYCIMWSFINERFTDCYYIVHTKEDEMGRAIACMRETKMHTEFCSKNLKGRYNSEDISIGGRKY
jgi:hypothetical protein